MYTDLELTIKPSSWEFLEIESTVDTKLEIITEKNPLHLYVEYDAMPSQRDFKMYHEGNDLKFVIPKISGKQYAYVGLYNPSTTESVDASVNLFNDEGLSFVVWIFVIILIPISLMTWVNLKHYYKKSDSNL